MLWLNYVIPSAALIVGLAVGYLWGRSDEHVYMNEVIKQKYTPKEG